MTALVPYETGTISVAADGTAVVGVGPNWSSTNVRPGDRLDSGHFSALIVEVVDQTHLTITPWPGATLSGAQYKIWPNYPQRVVGAEAMSTVNRLVADLSNRDIPVIVGANETEPDPSLGDDDQYADQPTTGKKWVKVGGVWTFIGIFKALRPRGDYDNDATYSVGDWVNSAGSSYVWNNETPGSGHAPPNATYWDVLAAKGADGADGAAATVTPGTVTTGPGGSAAAVTNSGTPTAAVFDFTIPAGKSYGGTSTTSRTIGAGSLAFTTQAGLAYQDGARVRASSAADPSDWMEGIATYGGTTLTIFVDKTNGSGTFADWNFNVAGEVGSASIPTASMADLIAGTAATFPDSQLLFQLLFADSLIQNNTTDPSNDIDVLLDGSAVVTKRLDAAWAAGTNQGGLDAGTKAINGSYHLYLLRKNSDGTLDAIFSASATAPTIPSGYTKVRALGAITTNGSGNIRAFKQFGDYFQYVAPVREATSLNINTTPTYVTLTIPHGAKLMANMFVLISAAGGGYTSIWDADLGISVTTTDWLAHVHNTGINESGSRFICPASAAGQICFYDTASGSALTLNSVGWWDPRVRRHAL